MALPQYMPVSQKVMSAMQDKAQNDKALQDKSMWRALLNSGLPGVEAVIDEYINKYSFPMRLNRAHLAMSAAIERGMQEAELIKQLETDEHALCLLQSEIRNLKTRRDQGFNTQAYKARLQQEGRDLPIEVHNVLNELESNVKILIRDIGNQFRDETSVVEAESQVDNASQKIKFEFNRIINEYEQAFSSSQELMKGELLSEYQKYVATLFPESRELELPAFQALKRSISAIPLEIEVSQKDIYNKSVVSGYRTVSDSTWYNPFSWFSTREVTIYREEKFVNLQDLWKTQGKMVRDQFESLKNDAIKRIREDKDKLIDNYLAFLDGEFNTKFAAVLEDLNQKAEDQALREKAILQAKADIEEIRALKHELEAILQF